MSSRPGIVTDHLHRRPRDLEVTRHRRHGLALDQPGADDLLLRFGGLGRRPMCVPAALARCFFSLDESPRLAQRAWAATVADTTALLPRH